MRAMRITMAIGLSIVLCGIILLNATVHSPFVRIVQAEQDETAVELETTQEELEPEKEEQSEAIPEPEITEPEVTSEEPEENGDPPVTEEAKPTEPPEPPEETEEAGEIPESTKETEPVESIPPEATAEMAEETSPPEDAPPEDTPSPEDEPPEDTPIPEEMPPPEETPPPEDTPYPEATQAVEDMPTPEETPVPEETQGPEEPVDCEMDIGNMEFSPVSPGDRFTLAVPIRCVYGDEVLNSNIGASGKTRPYQKGQKPDAFDQSIGAAVKDAYIAILMPDEEDFPLTTDILSRERAVVDNGENRGYAVFEDAQVAEDAEPGVYRLRFLLKWVTHDGEERSKRVDARFEVAGPAEVKEAEPDDGAAGEGEEGDIPDGTAQGEGIVMVEEDGEAKIDAETGDMAPGLVERPAAEAGGPLTLAVAVRYECDGQYFDTNRGIDGAILPYGGELTEFDASIANVVPEIYVSLSTDQMEGFPLIQPMPSERHTLVHQGTNQGYAVFDGLTVREDAELGIYTVGVQAKWLGKDGEWREKRLSYAIEITENAGAGQEDDGVSLGDQAVASGEAGGMLLLAVPICYTREGENYSTNADDEGGVIPYEDGRADGADAYDQSIADVLSHMTVEIVPDGSEELLPKTGPSQPVSLVSAGENCGYAVFDDLSLAATAEGEYPLTLRVSWETPDGESRAQELEIPVRVAAGEELLYGDNGVIVFTHAQLKWALESTQYDPVYLGYCDTDRPEGSWESRNDGVITYPTGSASGIQVARSVTLVGTDPDRGNRLKLVDNPKAFSRTPSNDGIHISAGISFTLRDVQVEGYSCSGIVASLAGNATISFVNVSYTGCRAFGSVSSNNTLSLTGCDITIQSMNGSGAVAQDAARLGQNGQIHLYGSNTIRRSGGTGEYDAVFWLSSAPGRLTVHDNARVTIDTNNFLVREHSGATVQIDGMLNLTTRGANGCMNYQSETIPSCTVNGELIITHNNSNHPSMQVASLMVNGALDIAKYSGIPPCIMLPSGGSAVFNSPSYVSLFNPGGFLIRSSSGTASVSITTQAMNLWGGNDIDRYIWNNNDLSSPFTITATVRTSRTDPVNSSGLSGGRGVALGAQAPNTTNCNFLYARRILLGQYSASIDASTVYHGSGTVRGRAPAGSTQKIEEYLYTGSALGRKVQSVNAIGDTNYRTGDDWNPISSPTSRIYLLSTANDLEVHIYRDCADVCALYSVPQELDFGTITISGSEQIVPRINADWAIEVVDTRGSGNWALKANAAFFTSEDGLSALPGTLIFIGLDGSLQLLSETEAVIVARKSAGDSPGIVEIAWPQDKGLLIFLAPYAGAIDTSYSTTIIWTLEVY